ncbi:BTB/POZ domain-containing protein 6-like [Paramacrobiotus metropolitanus]|uniref:BTB/POZ domain-containing protein 6-like n=1 Tax=Paramacrobiotus metropolitanus TaxID=2943436 RepID=UPI0024458E3B|nr:BTB/POZ domain-containing protein 6-like [Paramacrobiotus metropolitanus]
MEIPAIPAIPRKVSTRKERPPAATASSSKPQEPVQRSADWQNDGELTASQRNEIVLRNGSFSDVLFHVGKKQVPVYAHKLLLAMGSTVFAQMVYDENLDIPKVLEDVEPDVFEILLMSVYSIKEDNVDASNATAVLKAARTYGARRLEVYCMGKVYDSIDADDHCAMWTTALAAGDADTAERALARIDEAFDTASQQASFLALSVKDLVELFRRDTLKADEMDVYHAAERWAEAVCKQHKSDDTPQNRRTVLGEALDQIRFPLMTPEELTNGPVKTGLLQPQDVTDIMRYWFQKPTPVIRFRGDKRSGTVAMDADDSQPENEENEVPDTATETPAQKRKTLLQSTPDNERKTRRTSGKAQASPEKVTRVSNKKQRF